MRIIDFLIYYTVTYFNNNRRLLTWSTAVERACYALALSTVFWIFGFWQVTDDYILKIKDPKMNGNLTIVLLIGVVVGEIALLQYVYINRNRYELITTGNYKKFPISEKTGMIILLIFYIMSFIFPIALAILAGLKYKGIIP